MDHNDCLQYSMSGVEKIVTLTQVKIRITQLVNKTKEKTTQEISNYIKHNRAL
ncbi:hypothetical protein B7P43_G06629 [Cryptotermes secundus]|uniref:Uncharacterized protein n=1 Tax=Cryptotermes secundus TaxID=105785 RepID=A0A2J7PUJ7_9NEOP|nr:hypothetical protein B7P43_G06629 [Cryptotermes secundus]